MQSKKPTPQHKSIRLPDLFTALEQAGEEDLLITAQALILCGLPYRKTDAPRHIREAKTAHGTVRLTVTALDEDTPLPFGKDRAVLAWITTKALQADNPRVEWATAGEYLDAFGLDKGGRGYRLLGESWERLAKASILLEVRRNEAKHIRPTLIFERADLPTARDTKDEEEHGLVLLPGMKYGVELGRTLWENLRSHPVPLSLSLMREFQDEPKAWDFVAFVSWRSYVCRETSRPARIPWRDLLQQIGSEDSNQKRLRKTLKSILQRLHGYWPELRAEFLPGGALEIAPPVKGVLPVNGRQDPTL